MRPSAIDVGNMGRVAAKASEYGEFDLLGKPYQDYLRLKIGEAL